MLEGATHDKVSAVVSEPGTTCGVAVSDTGAPAATPFTKVVTLKVYGTAFVRFDTVYPKVLAERDAAFEGVVHTPELELHTAKVPAQ